MTDKTTVAVLGLGAMGHAFAANLIDKDFPTRIWNRTHARGEDLARAGATQTGTPREAAQGAEVVITMVPDAAATEQVLMGEDGALAGMRDGAILAQMGTIGVAGTDALIRQIGDTRPDVIFVDAPVSGTKAPAEKGQVLVLASGDQGASAIIDPVFAAIGKDTRWLGAAGAGSRMKLVVNAWLIAMMQGLAETTRLAESLDFTGEDLWNVLDGGPLAAPYAKVKLGMIASGNFDAQMALKWGLKDANLALEAAGDGVMPSLQRISQIWTEAEQAGHGEQDIAAIYQHLHAAD